LDHLHNHVTLFCELLFELVACDLASQQVGERIDLEEFYVAINLVGVKLGGEVLVREQSERLLSESLPGKWRVGEVDQWQD